MRYDLIGIDLDGTLLSPRGEISPANQRAIADAQAAGVTVVPSTGRAWHESSAVAALPGLDFGVFVTGASINRITDGSCVHLAEFEPHLVAQLIDILGSQPEAVLVYREPGTVGHNYLVTGQGQLTDNSAWWFEKTGAAVHTNAAPQLDNLRACLRVGMVADSDRLEPLAQLIGKEFAGHVELHHFPAVVPDDPNNTLHILEIFPAGVTKWHGLSWVASQQNIDPERIAFIGDEVNDIPAITHAACGIAMGNAITRVKDAAQHTTQPNTDDGVAFAINKLLAGEW